MFWLIFSVLLWGFLHSVLASFKVKELFLRRFGQHLARFYRLAYNLFAGLSFMPVLVIAAMTPDRQLYLVPLPWSVLMGIGEILAVIALVVAFRQTDAREFLGVQSLTGTGKSKPTGAPLETRGGRLVTAGLYRYVRHPLYSAGIAFVWLMPLMTVNVLAINIALTVYVVIGAFFEERRLLHEFGREYVDYAAITPMFIPFLRGNKTPR